MARRTPQVPGCAREGPFSRRSSCATPSVRRRRRRRPGGGGGRRPCLAGPPGKWTVISGGAGSATSSSPACTARPTARCTWRSCARTPLRRLHRHRPCLRQRQAARAARGDRRWEGVTERPGASCRGATGGIRIVFGGHAHDRRPGSPTRRATSTGRRPTRPGPCGPWLRTRTPALAHTSGYASYGTGVTTLADGTLVSAYPLNSTIYFQVGVGAVQSFDVGDCCAYDMTLVSDGTNVWAAWYANGDTATTRGMFVRQIHPVLGVTVQAPGGVELGGGSWALDGPGRGDGQPATGAASTSRTARGTRTRRAWCSGSTARTRSRSCPARRAPPDVAMSDRPGGRLWLAWDGESDKVHAVRTSPRACGSARCRT